MGAYNVQRHVLEQMPRSDIWETIPIQYCGSQLPVYLG